LRIEEVIASIDARIAELLRIAAETKAALEALESLEKETEMIVSLGGGVLAKVDWKGALLLDVGGGIALEKSPEEVKERLERRLKNIEEQVKRLEEEKRKVLEQVQRR